MAIKGLLVDQIMMRELTPNMLLWRISECQKERLKALVRIQLNTVLLSNVHYKEKSNDDIVEMITDDMWLSELLLQRIITLNKE